MLNWEQILPNFTWKKDAELDKSRPWKIDANLGEFGAKSVSIPLLGDGGESKPSHKM